MRAATLLLLWALLISQGFTQEEGREESANGLESWGTKIDPDKDCLFTLKKKNLTIQVPGTPHDLSAELNRMNAPRFVREVEGNFTAAVFVDGDFEPGKANIAGRTAYNGAGLLLMQDEENYIRLERAVLERGGVRQHYANFELRQDGRVQRIGTPGDMQLDPDKACLLRLERNGQKIRGIVRQGTKAWEELTPKNIDWEDKLQVGVVAINASTKTFEAKFSGFVCEHKLKLLP